MFEKPLPNVSGLLPDTFDPKDVWVDELLGGEEEIHIPSEYKIKDLEFEPQGSYPFCVAFSVTKLVEEFLRKKHGVKYTFSQPKLFYDAGGSIRGTYFRSGLNVAKQDGCMSYGKAPMPEPIWGNDQFYELQGKYKAIPYKGDEPKILGYARVNGYSDIELKEAVLKHGPILIGVAASGGYWSSYTKRAKTTDNHACILVGWDEHGWIVFDSLQPRTDFSGYHTLDKSYTFSSAYAVVEVEDPQWREKVYEKRKEGFEHCLNHYGQPRNFPAEQEAAALLTKEFKKFKNQSVWEAAGKFWTAYVNAVAYGGYNASYMKWGLWQSGDVINDCYHWRRTGQHIFDFNKLRSEHE